MKNFTKLISCLAFCTRQILLAKLAIILLQSKVKESVEDKVGHSLKKPIQMIRKHIDSVFLFL